MKSGGDGVRVVMFTPWQFRCGISDYSHLLADALRTLPEIADLRIVPTRDLTVRGGMLSALAHYPAAEREYAQLGERLNQQDTHIAHIQHQYFFFGGVAPHKNHAQAFLDAIRIPVVMTVHEIAQAGVNASPPLRAAIGYTNRRNFRHPAIRALVVHTPGDREQLLALGITPEKIHVLMHPTPPAAPMPNGEEAKRAFGLAGKRVVTLFGFLAAKKGHLKALIALPMLPPDVVLVFAGGQHPQDHTDYVNSLRNYAAHHRVEDRFRITGYLEEAQIPIIMAATDVAIAPFTHTSGSGSLANLFAYGRPVIASNIAPHQVIAQEQPGCLELFHTTDAADLAARIRSVLDDNLLRSRLQNAALAYAQQHSYLEMAMQTAQIYQGIKNKG